MSLLALLEPAYSLKEGLKDFGKRPGRQSAHLFIKFFHNSRLIR